MDNGVALADVAQKLVAQSFTFAGAFHQSGNIDNVAYGGHDASWMNDFGEFGQSLVRHGYLTHLGVDSTKRKVCRLCLCTG